MKRLHLSLVVLVFLSAGSVGCAGNERRGFEAIFYDLPSIPSIKNPLRDATKGEWAEYNVKIQGPAFLTEEGTTKWSIMERGIKSVTIERTGYVEDRIVLPRIFPTTKTPPVKSDTVMLKVAGVEHEATRIRYTVDRAIEKGPNVQTDITLWFADDIPVLGLLKEERKTVISKPDGSSMTVTDTLEYIRGSGDSDSD